MILEVYRNAGDDKPFAVFGGGAFDFEYMNGTLIVTTQRATKQFEIKHLDRSVSPHVCLAYEEWESYRDPKGTLKK